MKKSLLLKVLVSVGLLVFLLTKIDFLQLFELLASASLSYGALALAIYVLSQVVSCFRWVLLARSLGFSLPMKRYLSYYFIGMFFSLFAPSTIGGDVGRIFYLAREKPGDDKSWGQLTTYALVSVMADRIIGMAVLVWIGTAALLAFPDYSLPAAIHYLTYAMSAGLLLAWLLSPVFDRLLRLVHYSAGEHLRRALETYRRKPGIVFQAILLSLVVHGIQSSIHVFIGWALDLHIPWSYAFILYPLVGLFSALPISLNGIGLREGGYVFMLGQVGFTSEKALAFGLLWFSMVTLDSLIGGIVFLLTRTSPLPAGALQIGSRVKD